MARVLRSPRPVPPLDAQAMRAAGKPAATNDEVAAILKGLQLDKKFFSNRILAEPLKDLVPVSPRLFDEGSMGGSPSSSPAEVAARHRKSRVARMSTQSMAAAENARGDAGAGMNPSDFDIYLNEAVTPVLAQALDALCRQITLMEKQGDNLDPKVRERFNPITCLAQQLLRRHPRCARTPRRQAIYKNFREWSDHERGRRELLRRKDKVQQVFSGFMLRGAVQMDTIPAVIDAVDDSLHLGGVLKGSRELQQALRQVRSPQDSQASRPAVKRRGSLFNGDRWSFEMFWYHFASVIMAHDVVPYSVIARGIQLMQQEALEREYREDLRKKAEEEEEKQVAENLRLTAEYTSLYERLSNDPHLLSILLENKILTGDDVRPGDAGYEFEVPPQGQHVTLLAEVLALLGFSNLGHSEEERWWDAEIAGAWTFIQEVHRADLADGVVEKEVLEQVLVPPTGFMMLKQKCDFERERRAEDRDNEVEQAGINDPGVLGSKKKPTKEALAQMLGMTMARIEWLHQLFESFLVSDEPEEEGALPPCCLYPDCPAAIKKDQMRALMSEVAPNLGQAEFEAKFLRIDEDGSGMIEFDEFVHWVHQDEIQVVGSANRKMSLDELAQAHNEPLAIIEYLHTCFQDQFPEGQVDGYPCNPAALEEAEARHLKDILTPNISDEDFETSFRKVDIMNRGAVDFDEFLEVLDLESLPAELRDRY